MTANTINKQTRIERILEPFGANHSSALIDFFTKIAEHECDSIIFLARKSLCIYRMMELCGVKRPKAVIYSDTIISSGLAVLKGQKVLVVDDTLFVGTTLAETKEKLDTVQDLTAEYWVYCADTETWDIKTFKPDHIHKKLSEQETIEFCASECRAMINAGIPYLTDFAATKKIPLTPSQLDQAIKPTSWYFFDTSTQLHETSKVKYYSALPDQYVSQMVKQIIGSSLFSLIEIAKLRFFAAWFGKYYEVTIVPVVTFGPMDSKSISTACLSICKILGVEYEEIGDLPASEKVRVLQYLVGAIYLNEYWTYFRQIRNDIPSRKFDFSWCSSSFPSKIANEIEKGIHTAYSIRKLEPPPATSLRKLSEPKEIQEETRNDIDDFLKDYFDGDVDSSFRDTPLSDLTAIFLEFHRRFERAAREEIRDKVQNPKFRDRLKRGIAWGPLSKYLLQKNEIDNTRYKRNLLSIFLDRLIDYGISVPIIAECKGRVYRAYRYGEDVRFGAQEENLIYKMLDGFQNGRGSEGFEATYFEKLIVILLRVGMNEEWLNLWYTQSGRDTMVRVGFHLQGAVPIVPGKEDELVPEGEMSWLSRRLCKTGMVIAPADGSKKYRLSKEPQAAHAKRDAARTASSLGFTVGKACIGAGQRRSPSKPIGTEDLIVLTSASNLQDTVGAVAAELLLFSSSLRTILKQCPENLRNGFHFGANELKRSYGQQAVNSGMWKIEKFESSEINHIKNKLLDLSKHDPEWANRKSYWEAIFDAFSRPLDDSNSNKLSKILEKQKLFLACCDAIIKTLALITESHSKRFLPDEFEKVKVLGESALSALPSGMSYMLPKLRKIYVGPEKVRPISDEAFSDLADAFRIETLRFCDSVTRTADTGVNSIIRSNKKLSRKEYRFVVWYDILDVRVRKQGTPDNTEEYANGIEQFRPIVNSILADATERLRKSGCDIFCDTGEIRSRNDEKHVFISGPAADVEREGAFLAASIAEAAFRSNIRTRILGSQTNLRGEYVFLNKGETSIDGDFKSHLHTIINEIKHHELEDSLEIGQSVLWLTEGSAKRMESDTLLDFVRKLNSVNVKVNIRGTVTETEVHPFLCALGES